MSKLIFRYGSMNSSKTANLLMVAYNYKAQNKKVILLKPELDNRFGQANISSRIGISDTADIVINKDTDLILEVSKYGSLDCILVDEAQFLPTSMIDQLRSISAKVTVICYGLRTDYKLQLFPGSKRLFELADTFEEIKTVCIKCNTKSTVNGKFRVDSKGIQTIVRDGSDELDLGAEDKYQPLCWHCWNGK